MCLPANVKPSNALCLRHAAYPHTTEHFGKAPGVAVYKVGLHLLASLRGGNFNLPIVSRMP